VDLLIVLVHHDLILPIALGGFNHPGDIANFGRTTIPTGRQQTAAVKPLQADLATRAGSRVKDLFLGQQGLAPYFHGSDTYGMGIIAIGRGHSPIQPSRGH
jgi:hypothetical protein